MTYRVIAWSTGNVGKHAIAGIDANPELDLIGVYVSNPDKVGKDAGQLAGLGRDLGVLASNDAAALLAMKPDCIVHTAWVDDRLMEGLADLSSFLEAGINVVSSGPVFLQYPYGVADGLAKGVIDAAETGGASIFVNGIDPGFGNDTLPLMITGISERIEEVRAFASPWTRCPSSSNPACQPWRGDRSSPSWRQGSGSSSSASRSGTSGCRHLRT